MANIYDVEQSELVNKAAEELKKIPEIKAPEWAEYVKTSTNREKAPLQRDWWYKRSASILRLIYRQGPIGVSKLRTKYGGKKNRGARPEIFFKASGNIIRKVLQQLEKAGFVKQAQIKTHKGRIITPKGRTFLDKIAGTIYNIAPVTVAKKEAKQPDKKADEQKKPEAMTE